MTLDAERTRPSLFLVFFGSLLAMVPWPLLGISLSLLGSVFEQASDSVLLFGGVTLLFLLPIGMFDPPEWVVATLIVSVWIFVLLLPILVALPGKRWKGQLVVAYVLQAGFSLAQAGFGLLMIVGRGV